MRIQCANKTEAITNDDTPFAARGIYCNTAGTAVLTYDDGSTDTLTCVAGGIIPVAGGQLKIGAASTGAFSAFQDTGAA